MTPTPDPDAQCAVPGCEAASVGVANHSLCERHQEDIGAEPVTESNRNDTVEGVRHTSDSKSRNTNTHDGVEAGGDDEDGRGVTSASKPAKPGVCTPTEARRSIPAPLNELGQVFVPIDPGEKGTRRPRTEEHLFTPDDPVIEAYLEAGHNYGVVCRGDLAVLDADEPAALAELIDALPETASQVSGSRSSEHHLLRVPGLDEDIPLDDPETGENLGHIKAASQSYVVGPGSRHPSGNRYGPLQGDRIATVDEAELREIIDPFRPDTRGATASKSGGQRSGGSTGDTPIDIDDVVIGYSEGVRTEHPFHGSDTGANFMIDEDGDTWRCWRHGCTGNALHLVGIEQNVIDCGEWDSGGLDTETWSEIFTAAREDGYDLPEYESAGSGDRFSRVVECPAPDDDLEAADVDGIRAAMRGERYDEFVEHTAGPTVWQDVAGTGKTTTAHLAADDRDRSLAELFDKHRKAHEHRDSGLTPDVDLHLRGAAQPRHDACANAAYTADVCDAHGDVSNCPRMCPVYDLGPDHPDRRAFEAVAAEVGPVRAHVIVDPHDGDDCRWFDALGRAPDVHSLVGVHEYQRLKTVRAPEGDARDVLVDESPGALADDRRLAVEDLVRLANTLEDWRGRDAAGETLRRVGAFAREVADAVIEGEPLGALEAPVPVWDAYESYDTAAGNRMEYVDAEGDDVERWQTAEALARARRAFLDYQLAAIRDEGREWDGTPLAIDALLAAAAAAGLDEGPVRVAAGRPTELERCPRCSADLGFANGARACEGCGWDERDDLLTTGADDPARILAWVDAEGGPDSGPAFVRRRLPKPSQLPDDPLVLDATATPENVAAFYGADPDDVAVHGAEQHALDGGHVAQITDGQYHYGTLKNAVEESHASAEQIQTHLDRLGELYDRPLIAGKQSLPELFDLPPNAEFIHFHGGRGLNFSECDAATVVGAPHPNMEDLERTARLLAQGQEDVDVGGVEHSTRRDENGDLAAKPPVYRKLRYSDDEGRGRAVATKHYTGLVGALFREAREKEIEQLVHRIRPLLADADAPKHVYLLTNVPTDLPVDEVCTLEELAEAPAASLDVADGAFDLAEVLADVAEGNGPDGFRAGTLVGRDGAGGVRFKIRQVHRLAGRYGIDVSERTVRRWIDDLQELGLVDAGDYEPRAGVGYSADAATLTRALSVLTGNAGVEVAIKRRIAALAVEADSAAAWLRRVRELLALSGASHAATPAAAAVDGPPDPGGDAPR